MLWKTPLPHAFVVLQSSSSLLRGTTSGVIIAPASPSTRMMMATNDVSSDKADDFVMLGDYPFYYKQPTEKMNDVFEENATNVRKALGEKHLVSIHRIGSSAIPNMPGTPVVDMLAVLDEYPLTDAQLQALSRAGFPNPMQNSVHAENDTWFFGGCCDNEDKQQVKPGHLGRCVLHVVGQDNPWISDALAFVDYCHLHPQAFERYKNVKLKGVQLGLQGVEGEKLSEYKRAKASVVLELMQEAKTWRSSLPATTST